MSVTVKLLSLNIEGDKHLDKVIPLIQKEKPDVVCLQEVFEYTLPLFQKELKMQAVFFPTLNIIQENIYRISPKGIMGLAIFTGLKVLSIEKKLYYKSRKANPPLLVNGRPNSLNRGVVIVGVEKSGQKFQVATTHFTWSRKGASTKTQLKSVDRLLPLIDLNNTVLCGDFNAPRGKQTWAIIAGKLKDNIPENVTTTIDAYIHRAGDLGLVVDGLFSSRNYKISDVKVISGVSDHCAIVANIEYSTFDVENI